MRSRIIQIIDLILNVTIVVLTMISFLYYQFPNKNEYIVGLTILKYFTMDSNIFVAIASLIIIPYNIINIKKNRSYIPLYASTLKYLGTVSVMLTMLTVIIFLGPTQGFGLMYKNVNFYMHLLTPLLALISYSLLEGIDTDERITITSIIPMTIYGIVYMTNVLHTKRWNDFYGFNINGKWRITFLVMLIATYLIGLFVYFLPKILNKINKQIKQKKSKKETLNISN